MVIPSCGRCYGNSPAAVRIRAREWPQEVIWAGSAGGVAGPGEMSGTGVSGRATACEGAQGVLGTTRRTARLERGLDGGCWRGWQGLVQTPWACSHSENHGWPLAGTAHAGRGQVLRWCTIYCL